MKRLFFLCLLICFVSLPAICLAKTSKGPSLTQNDRLLQKPEWDGAVMQAPKLEGGVNYEEWDYNNNLEGNYWDLGLTFITSLPSLRKLELGGRLGYFINVDYNTTNLDEESGLSDIDIWGKYQLYTSNDFLLSAGLTLTLPTGSEDVLNFRASGEFNYEMFFAGRYQASNRLAAIGHLGLRQNGDMKIQRSNGTQTEIDGELQIELGGGVLYQATTNLQLQGEINFATEPYDSVDNDIQLRGGADYAFSNSLHLRGGLSVGLDDGAPDYGFTVRVAYLFYINTLPDFPSLAGGEILSSASPHFG